MARCVKCYRRLAPGLPCAVHGAAASPVLGLHDGPPPTWWEPLDRCIGSGGFASVWEIRGGGVLKVAHVDHDQARARMRREAEALAAIGAPTVPRLDDQGVFPDGRAWISMERIVGENLGDLTTNGPLRSDRAISIGLAILDALAKVHAANFVHRDLKPDNLVLRPDRSIAILDFGLARKLPTDPDDPTRANTQVGSLEYMPPEQLIDPARVDQRADLYAFGCVLFELCAGRPPFVNDAAALARLHAAMRPPPLSAFAAIPTELELLVHECLAKLPARRPQTVAALRASFSALRDTTPPSVRTLRADHSWAVIREGKHPVVLLWAELPRVDRALLAILASHKLSVISQRGRRVLAAAAGVEHPHPEVVAVATARDLAAAGARVALHLDELRVIQDTNGIAFAGPAVDKPEAWLPTAPWTDVVITRALAAVTHVPIRPSDLGPRFVALGDPNELAQLFGREALLADLSADVTAATAGLGPSLAVLIGEPGIGKSAFAAALGPRLHELHGIKIIAGTVPPPGSLRPSYSALGDLVGTPEGPLVRAIGDAIRAAARAQPTAIILDDVHLADATLLDALEYATLGGEPLSLWIIAIANSRLDLRRPGFGQRAERHRRDTLGPLEEDDAVNLIAAALRPAEYPPLRALRQIAGIARGNPLHLRALTREIHDMGAIRPRANGEHFLDTTALDSLPPIALGPWLAARELDELPAELVGLARVCAVLGDEVDRDEVAAVVEIVETRGGATTSIDVDIGLEELVTAGVLVAGPQSYRFAQSLVKDGIYGTTDEEERRELHRAALDHWSTRASSDPAVAERLARHAEAVGERAIAAEAFATLGEHAHEEHRALDADQAFTGALRHLEARNAARARALIGRARARYRIQRVRDSIQDLEQAIDVALELNDSLLEIEALLEQATAFDLSEDIVRSKESAERAAVTIETRVSDPPRAIVMALALARGRTAFRENRMVECIPVLRVVIESGVPELSTVAGLLLGYGLVDVGDLEAAASVFDDVIATCDRTGDRFHLAAAYNNRAWLWSAQGAIERVADDLRTVIGLAREGGFALVERHSTHNLAENKLWEGETEEALRLARRSLALAQGHGELGTGLDRILLARIFAARNELEALASTLESIRPSELADDELWMLDVLKAVGTTDELHWKRALEGIEHLPSSHRIEMLKLASRHGHLTEERLDEVATLRRGNAIWGRRETEV